MKAGRLHKFIPNICVGLIFFSTATVDAGIRDQSNLRAERPFQFSIGKFVGPLSGISASYNISEYLTAGIYGGNRTYVKDNQGLNGEYVLIRYGVPVLSGNMNSLQTGYGAYLRYYPFPNGFNIPFATGFLQEVDKFKRFSNSYYDNNNYRYVSYEETRKYNEVLLGIGYKIIFDNNITLSMDLLGGIKQRRGMRQFDVNYFLVSDVDLFPEEYMQFQSIHNSGSDRSKNMADGTLSISVGFSL